MHMRFRAASERLYQLVSTFKKICVFSHRFQRICMERGWGRFSPILMKYWDGPNFDGPVHSLVQIYTFKLGSPVSYGTASKLPSQNRHHCKSPGWHWDRAGLWQGQGCVTPLAGNRDPCHQYCYRLHGFRTTSTAKSTPEESSITLLRDKGFSSRGAKNLICLQLN